MGNTGPEVFCKKGVHKNFAKFTKLFYKISGDYFCKENGKRLSRIK